MAFTIGQPETGTVGRKTGQPLKPEYETLVAAIIALPDGQVLPVTLPVHRGDPEIRLFGIEVERHARAVGYTIKRSSSDGPNGVTIRLMARKLTKKGKTEPTVNEQHAQPEQPEQSEPRKTNRKK